MTRANTAALTTEEIPIWIGEVVANLGDLIGGARPVASVWLPDHSNEIHEVSFDDGRILLVKRGWHEWSEEQFRISEAAARLIAAESEIVVPAVVQLPAEAVPDAGGLPVQAYWRIPEPTLAELWPSLGDGARRDALRSVGELLRRLHDIEPDGFGPVDGSADCANLEEELNRDLHHRLVPAVYSHWPDGLRPLERLIERIPDVAQRSAAARPALVHRDVHTGNVLCRVDGDTVEAIGMLDLDEVSGGAPESDLANFDIMHGPIFERYIAPAQRHALVRGYGAGPDRFVLEFFRCANLVNQGFSSAMLGHEEHAERIAGELRRRMRRLYAREKEGRTANRAPR